MLSPTLLTILREYWREEKPGHDWLFPGGSPGKPLSSTSVQKTCKKAAKDAGLSKNITPHSLRHSFAVDWIWFDPHGLARLRESATPGQTTA